MVCVYCSSPTKVTNSRSAKSALQTWRRRECVRNKKHSFTTFEKPDLSKVMVVEKDGALSKLTYEELFLKVHSSLAHIKDGLEPSIELTTTTVGKLLGEKTPKITAAKMNEIIYGVLVNYDAFAGEYYKRHYT